MTDLAIRNVRVLDGSGGAAFAADVEVDGGRITSVGRAGAAKREIDGKGLCLAPGFIDTHAHDDGAFFRYPGMEFKLAQGVTTVVSGNCGFSAIPGRSDERCGGGERRHPRGASAASSPICPAISPRRSNAAPASTT